MIDGRHVYLFFDTDGIDAQIAYVFLSLSLLSLQVIY